MNRHTTLSKIVFSSMVISIYIIIMFMTQAFASGLFQIRIATSLYALPAVFPFLVLPLSLANSLSNFFVSGLGMIDVIGGLIVGLLTSSSVYFIRKLKLNDWFIALPIIFIPGLVVPIWLTPILVKFGEELTYSILAASIISGQIIPGIVGVFIVKELKKRKISYSYLRKHID